jgi:hypothetical protein
MAITDLIANNMSFDPVGSYMKGYGASQAIASNKRAIQNQDREAAIQQQKMALAEKEDMRARGQEFVLSISPVVEKINALGTPEEKQAAYSQALPVLAKQAQDLGLPADKLPPQWNQNEADMILGAAQRLGKSGKFGKLSYLTDKNAVQLSESGEKLVTPFYDDEGTPQKLAGEKTLAQELSKVSPKVTDGMVRQEGQVKLAGELGKLQATAINDLPAINAGADTIIDYVDKLVKHPGMKDVVGLPDNPIGLKGYMWGTPAADFKARLDQLTGKSFLQVFPTLKGGGQITEIEGEKATNAVNRMKTAVSEKEFLLAAKDFNREIEELRQIVKNRASGNYENKNTDNKNTSGWSIKKK